MTKSAMISYLTNWGSYYETLLWDVCTLTVAQLRAEVAWCEQIDAGDEAALYE